ncbi:amino acid deaminase/aldolase [Streptomyces sp. NPDC005574]|uniref:amino acid deaminase/aldolase n=1 Tax=Streptomyces sp. NPDC005574 TaxID=3156891 RepID=UPI0033A8E171
MTARTASTADVTTAAGAPDRFDRLRAATAGLEPPFGVIDLDAFDANAADLERRAAGKPIRLASKSLRSRALIRRALQRPGFQGILGFTLPEALWLAEEFDDVLVGYPTADRTALRTLAADERLASRITLMVDCVEHLDLIDAATGPRATPVRVCLELDAALRLAGGRLHLGPRRSPVHTPAEAAAFARQVAARPGFELAGIMGYEGQIAGLGDNQPGSRIKRAVLRAMQHSSAGELGERRAAAVAAVRAVTPLRFVNGGGTGSLETTTREDAVTELAAGSGLYGPGLFDFYRAFRPAPAAFFVLPVVRRPTARIATLLGGGWVASGPPGRDRMPTPAWPPGLRVTATESFGEVQTPLVGGPAPTLRIGDRVWLRHAKAGELCERVGELHLVGGDEVIETVPTYRGEGRHFL